MVSTFSGCIKQKKPRTKVANVVGFHFHKGQDEQNLSEAFDGKRNFLAHLYLDLGVCVCGGP